MVFYCQVGLGEESAIVLVFTCLLFQPASIFEPEVQVVVENSLLDEQPVIVEEIPPNTPAHAIEPFDPAGQAAALVPLKEDGYVSQEDDEMDPTEEEYNLLPLLETAIRFYRNGRRLNRWPLMGRFLNVAAIAKLAACSICLITAPFNAYLWLCIATNFRHRSPGICSNCLVQNNNCHLCRTGLSHNIQPNESVKMITNVLPNELTLCNNGECSYIGKYIDQ